MIEPNTETPPPENTPLWTKKYQDKNGATVFINAYIKLPFDRSTLPDYVAQWDSPIPGYQQLYFGVFDEQGSPLGISLIHVESPKKTQRQANFSYNYVFPKHRSTQEKSRGLGRILSQAVIEWALDNDIHSIHSGINTVITLEPNGTIKPVINDDGSWRSFRAMVNSTLPNGRYPIRRISEAVIQGFSSTMEIDLGLILQLRDDQGNLLSSDQPTLPSDPNELFKYLQKNVFPPNLNPQQLCENGIQRYEGGQQVNLIPDDILTI